jgi:hypothetical protein
MAKRKAPGRPVTRKTASRSRKASRSVKRPGASRPAAKTATARKRKANPPTKNSSARKPARRAVVRRPGKAAARKPAKKVVAPAVKALATKRARPKETVRKAAHPIPARLDRERRILEETTQTPPSSLNMDRHGSAARTGRAEMRESLANHGSMTPAINAGDLDVNVTDAYFSGDEAPGGDNPTPDQDVVDAIGKALGVEYQDSEELRASDKVAERDKHRWELDPASSEDYRERKP